MIKIVGWTLLFAGLAIICYSLFASLKIFDGTKPAPAIFAVLESPKQEKGPMSAAPVEELIGETMREELWKIIPPEFLPKILNLVSWSTLALLMILAGAQISSLGIKLLKD